jgi:hypothetical protein
VEVDKMDYSYHLYLLGLLAILDLIAIYYDRKNQKTKWVSHLLSEEEKQDFQSGKVMALWPPKSHGAPVVLALFNFAGVAMIFTIDQGRAVFNIFWLALLVILIVFLRQRASRPSGFVTLVSDLGVECRYDAGKNVVSRKMEWQEVERVRLYYGGSVDGDSVLEGVRLSSKENEINVGNCEYNFPQLCTMLLELELDQKMNEATRNYVIKMSASSAEIPLFKNLDE